MRQETVKSPPHFAGMVRWISRNGKHVLQQAKEYRIAGPEWKTQLEWADVPEETECLPVDFAGAKDALRAAADLIRDAFGIVQMQAGTPGYVPSWRVDIAEIATVAERIERLGE